MGFSKYEAYKDSGVEWLGEVPEHWQTLPIKRIVSTPVTDGPHETPEFTDNGIPFVSAEAVSSGEIDFTKIRGFISKEDHQRYCQKYLPAVGDIYLVKSGASTGTTAIVRDSREFSIWSPLAAIRCNETAHPTFVLNYMRSSNFQEAVKLNWSFGTQQNIGMNVIENLQAILPPVNEQQAIAAFLDAETAKIDALVAEQRRLIALLQEKRQAVISHAVTKGLNPNAPMKPSGIQWLGDVPEHWEVCRLKRVFTSVDYGISDSLDVEGNIAVLRMGNIQDGKIDLTDLKYVSQVDEDLILFEGDLLYNRTNSLDLIGKVGMYLGNLEIPLTYASYLVRLRTTFDSTPRYLAYFLNTENMLGVARSLAFVAIGQCNLNPTRYGMISVAIPPRHEQDDIANFLDDELSKLTVLKSDTEKAIAILQERRTALISAAVTGKIDVRNYSSNGAAS